MALQVVNGAQMSCILGTSPANLAVLPLNRTMIAQQPKATVQDFVPMVNIMPFGMCISPSNPQVAAATAAALGVLTPQPCIPMTMSPWAPGAVTVEVNQQVSLDNLSMCNCLWGGVISIVDPGQTTVETP